MEKLGKEKIIAIVIGAIALIGIILIIIFKPFGNNIQAEREVALKELGKKFYEEFYYPQLGNGDEDARKELLDNFKDTGIKINVDNLSRFNTDGIEDMISKFDDCNREDSKVTIYPQGDYGINDYRLEIEIACD